jgi:hypothetical protein
VTGMAFSFAEFSIVATHFAIGQRKKHGIRGPLGSGLGSIA